MGFKIKRFDGYINGIGFEFTPMPLIFSFDISYSYPDNLQVIPQLIDNIIVRNKDKNMVKHFI